MFEKISIKKENGELVTDEFISCFKINIGGNDHIYYLTTSNEVDPNGLYKIKVSELINEKLNYIVSDADWSEVKNAMRAIISSSNGNYSYVEKKLSLSANNDYGRIIAVQLPARDKLAQDYKEKLPQVVINNIVSEPEPMVDTNSNYNNFQVNEDESVVAPGIVEKQGVENSVANVSQPLNEVENINNNIVNDNDVFGNNENGSGVSVDFSSQNEVKSENNLSGNVLSDIKIVIMKKLERLVDEILNEIKENNK